MSRSSSAGGPLNTEPDLAEGSLLGGRYRIGSVLGQGGTAVVYAARDLVAERDVAVKVLRQGVSAALGPARFLREIAIAGDLDHPNILPLLDSGQSGELLFYVMPVVSGQTLWDKISREKQLTADEALRIGRAIGSALAYAHDRGIVHRDIKPSNILLQGEATYVADFGLARAIDRAADAESLTTSGIVMGTPHYMAPEQGTPGNTVDGRCDLYGLGCVLYEMLTGDPPFAGSSSSTILLRHLSQPPAPIRTVRPSLPPWLDALVLRCLEKSPADRFQRAGDFLKALDLQQEPRPLLASRRILSPALLVPAVFLLGITLAAVVIAKLADSEGQGGAAPADTSMIAVFPGEGTASERFAGFHDRIGDALDRWDGVEVADRRRLKELVGSTAISSGRAAEIAAQLHAGRFIRTELTPFGDSVRFRATLYDAAARTLVHEAVGAAPSTTGAADSAVQRLADALLFRGLLPGGAAESAITTRSAPALQSYIQGRARVAAWDLPAADLQFSKAVSVDSGFTHAMLWLAQTRTWLGLPASQWRFHANRAAAGAIKLNSRDAGVASALVVEAGGDFGTACQSLLRLAERLRNEFTPWYSAATCLDADPVVVRSPVSPGGWAFRGSYHQAIRAWRRAFSIHPGIYRDYRNTEAPRRAWHLWNSSNQVREGRAAAPDTGVFMALPTWEGDSLAFIPRPAREFAMGTVFGSPGTATALRQQRQAFLQLATEWVAADPGNFEAREALGIALWMVGSSAALDTIRAAQRMTRGSADRARLGLTEVMMLLLRRAPDSVDADRAGRLADSLLTAPRTGWTPQVTATLAALRGRVSLSAEAWRVPSPRIQWRLPPATVGSGLALLVFAAGGGPADSLAVLEQRVESALGAVAEAERLDYRLEWLGRPAVLAYPGYRLQAITGLAGNGDYLIDAVVAQLAGSSSESARILDRARKSRSWMEPHEVPFEALLPEASLLAQSGQPRLAADLLDPTLSGLHRIPIRTILNPVAVLLMLRTIALRVELAQTLGEAATGSRWANLLGRLWSNPDPFLIPVRDRMRVLGRSTSP